MSVATRPPAFVNDLETCVGCHACAVACANENQLAPGTSWRHIVTFNAERRAGLPAYHLSLACNHCADAPCMTACPAVAIARDARTGAVLIDASRCIGCRYCSWVCPYDAPRFDDEAGVMGKCTLCHGRLLDGLAPACVAGCPVGALAVGEPADAEPAGVAGFPAMGIGPGIRFLPLRSRLSSQGAVAGAVAGPTTLPAPDPSPAKISSRSEWALVAFTFIAQVLVGLVLAATLAPARVPAWALLASGLVAIGVSTLHLGQPLRAWRAILNVRTSWLSREVLSWSAFLGLATVALGAGEATSSLRWVAAIAGLVCLACIDRVYVVMARRDRARLDDASALTAGVYFGAVAAGAVWVALLVALFRISAFQQRVNVARRGGAPASALPLVRSLLTAVGLALLAQDGAWAVAAGAVCVAVAEAVDRVVFYDTLGIVTPRTQMARDVVAACR